MTSSRTLPLARRRIAVGRVLFRTFTSLPTSEKVTNRVDVRVFSGIQPSGVPHLGNYCGAIAKWVRLQDMGPCDASSSSAAGVYDASASRLFSANHASPCRPPLPFDHSPAGTPLPHLTRLFAVVDLHALTVPSAASHLTSHVYTTVAALLAAGIDPTRSIVFCQSHVAAHAELAWLLSCVTPLTWLHRMTQFKQKTRQQQQGAAFSSSVCIENSLGLLSYPVLMAADILLYRATLVPVGDDQLQHLELARRIATAFARRFDCANRATINETMSRARDVLVKPWPMESMHGIGTRSSAAPLRQSLERIMSLRDPSVKMSKSDASLMSRIDLTDSAEGIRKKIRRATTDATSGISYDRRERPGVSNLLEIASAVTGESVAQLVTQYANYGTGAFKDSVADAVIAKICPIGDRIKQYETDLDYLDKVLANGAAQASEMAAVTMKEVREVMGLVKS